MLFWYTHFQKSPYSLSHISHTLPRSVTLCLHFAPLTNPGYTTVTSPPPPHWLAGETKQKTLMCKKFPHSVASLPRFAPCWKIMAMPVIILFMFVLYISRYLSVRNTHFPWICIFFLLFYSNFFQKIHPKCAPDRSISISKMQKAPWCGRGTPPPTPSPARALRALACVVSRIL